MTDTTKLAERIEALERDERIWFIRAYEAVHGTECIDPKAWRRFEDLVNAGAFLDAAMTLVPSQPYPEIRPGQWWWMVEAREGYCDAHVAYENHDAGIPEFSGEAATPALALCAAAIRAQEAHNG